MLSADGKDGVCGRIGTIRNESITISRALVTRMGEVVRELRVRIRAALADGQRGGPLNDLRCTITSLTDGDLSDDEFADLGAQLVVCGLLAARWSARREGSRAAVPEGVPLPPVLQRWQEALVAACEGGGNRGETLAGSLAALKTLLDQVDWEAVFRDFQNRCPDEDPVLHFYERFLQHYDASRRLARGVFFTPRAVVSHLVRSVHEVLQTRFGIADGLASIITWGEWCERTARGAEGARTEGRTERTTELPAGVCRDSPWVTILDPAAGSGAFLIEVIGLIHRTMQQKWSSQGRSLAEQQAAWNEYVPRHLLPRLVGYELLPAAHAIAHLTLVGKLRETGYRFAGDQPVRLYLTNALEAPCDGEPPRAGTGRTAPEFDAVRAADTVKREQRFTVVLGNPPYAGMSRNRSDWICGLLRGQAGDGRKWEDYYQESGVRLAERKFWLHDDYVKFLRYGHWLIERSGCGVLGYVTNHGYLDNPTFRGLRESLRATFSGITITDLHGSTKKTDGCPEGGADENVFSIESGVALGLFWRVPGACRAEIGHADLWGTRASKQRVLAQTTALQLNARRIEPQSPLYLFRPFDGTHGDEYGGGWKLTELMAVHGTGLVTARDHFVIAQQRQALLERMSVFRGELSDAEVRSRFFTGRTRSPRYQPGDTRGWRLTEARQRVRNDPHWQQRPLPCLYRPFDLRWVYYTDGMVDWPRRALMQHMLGGENLGLIARRQLPGTHVTYFFVADCLISDGVIRSDNKGSESLFPLYLMPAGAEWGGPRSPVANLNPEFLQALANAVQLDRLDYGRGDLLATFGPEDVLHFIYAQFYSPSYRARFAEWLRIDFPRIFLPASRALFHALCGCGSRLIRLHRLKPADDPAAHRESPPAEFERTGATTCELAGDGPMAVAAGYPRYRQGKVYLHPSRWFTGVSPAVWSFRIGAYPVCQKWLKDRRGQLLSPRAVQYYGRIVTALDATLRQMEEIEGAIQRHGGWPQAFLRAGAR